MDFLILTHEKYTVTYTIEDYHSLVWTERFLEPGEFLLKVTPNEDMISYLSPNTLVSIQQSSQIMMVETLLIELDEDGIPLMTVTGRSLDLLLGERAPIIHYGNIQHHSKPIGYDYAGRRAHDALANIVQEFLVGIPDTFKYWPASQCRVPNTTIKLDIRKTYPQIHGVESLSSGDMMEVVSSKIRSSHKLGLRFDRPLVETSPTTPGAWVVYDGHAESAIFSHSRGDLLSSSYIFTRRGVKNAVVYWYHDSERSWNRVYSVIPGGYYEGTGVNYRELFVAESQPITTDDMVQQVKDELAKHRNISYMECVLDPDVSVKYGVDFNLGDTVIVHGEYGITETMLVSEFVRSLDEKGYTSYPTLQKID